MADVVDENKNKTDRFRCSSPQWRWWHRQESGAIDYVCAHLSVSQDLAKMLIICTRVRTVQNKNIKYFVYLAFWGESQTSQLSFSNGLACACSHYVILAWQIFTATFRTKCCVCVCTIHFEPHILRKWMN